MLGSIDTKKWGAQLGQLSNGLKKATSQIVSESNKFVEGFKSTSEIKQTDSVTLTPEVNTPEVKQDAPPVQAKTTQTAGGLDVKKGVTMGVIATAGMTALGPMGALLGIYAGKEISDHGGVKEAFLANQEKLKGVSDKLSEKFKAFAGSVKTNTSTITVDNGLNQTKVAVNNGTNSSVPQSLTMIE
jgi:uncharacterized membrane protein